MSRLAIIELHKEELKFSAGHFMLFSATEREKMHGHDYMISAAFHTLIKSNGMAFDCREYKQKLAKFCQLLDYQFILPGQSDFMRLEDTGDRWIAYFGQETFSFLKKDVVVLPISNVTLEELSYWLLQQLTQNEQELKKHCIQGIALKVFNGRGESGAANWGKT